MDGCRSWCEIGEVSDEGEVSAQELRLKGRMVEMVEGEGSLPQTSSALLAARQAVSGPLQVDGDLAAMPCPAGDSAQRRGRKAGVVMSLCPIVAERGLRGPAEGRCPDISTDKEGGYRGPGGCRGFEAGAVESGTAGRASQGRAVT